MFGSTFEDFLLKLGLLKNIVYRVHIADIGQYRVHIARILEKNIAQAWSRGLFMALAWHPRPNHQSPAAFEKNAKNPNNPGFEPPLPHLGHRFQDQEIR